MFKNFEIDYIKKNRHKKEKWQNDLGQRPFDFSPYLYYFIKLTNT